MAGFYGFRRRGRPSEAPVLLATVVVIVATLAQILWLKARGRKVDTMLWISLGWSPCWAAPRFISTARPSSSGSPRCSTGSWALPCWSASWLLQEERHQVDDGRADALPDSIWRVVNSAGSAFLPSWACSTCGWPSTSPPATWVNFKLFGGLGLMLVFVLVQAVYLNKHIKPGTTP
jgi:intracellular septation protein